MKNGLFKWIFAYYTYNSSIEDEIKTQASGEKSRIHFDQRDVKWHRENTDVYLTPFLPEVGFSSLHALVICVFISLLPSILYYVRQSL